MLRNYRNMFSRDMVSASQAGVKESLSKIQRLYEIQKLKTQKRNEIQKQWGS